jgi:hypothetical protein
MGRFILAEPLLATQNAYTEGALKDFGHGGNHVSK